MFKKSAVSILISAYKTQNYIEECLNSVSAQTYFYGFDKYEILLGIDNCPDTLEKIKSIMHKYKNLRVFYMKQNVGTYVLTNTLLDIAKYGWILRFDSDDIMMPNMIYFIMNNKEDCDIVRFGFYNFTDDILHPKNIQYTYGDKIRIAHGTILIKTEILKRFGGYKDWMIGADTELLRRIHVRIKGVAIFEPLFYRRIHDDSLSNKKDSGMQSEKRKEIKKEVNNSILKNPYISLKKCDYECIL